MKRSTVIASHNPATQEHITMPRTTFSTKIQAIRRQRGFTLFELLIIVVILGVLAALAAPAVSDGQKMADVTAYYNTADRLATNWRYGTTKCQVSNTLGTSPVTGTATVAAHLTLLVEGTGLAAGYTACWNAAKIEPVNRNNVRGTTGAYVFNQSTVTIANLIQNGVNRVATTYTAVDDGTILELIQKYGGQTGASTMTAVPATADTTDPVIQFAAAGSGSRNLTIIR